MYAIGILDVGDSPRQVISHGVIDIDPLLAFLLATKFGIQVVERRTKEWEDIESLVEPSRQTLPMFQFETTGGVTWGF